MHLFTAKDLFCPFPSTCDFLFLFISVRLHGYVWCFSFSVLLEQKQKMEQASAQGRSLEVRALITPYNFVKPLYPPFPLFAFAPSYLLPILPSSSCGHLLFSTHSFFSVFNHRCFCHTVHSSYCLFISSIGVSCHSGGWRRIRQEHFGTSGPFHLYISSIFSLVRPVLSTYIYVFSIFLACFLSGHLFLLACMSRITRASI